MKYVVEMGSGGMIYVPSYIKIGSVIQKLMRRIHRHRQHGYRMPIFFTLNKKLRLVHAISRLSEYLYAYMSMCPCFLLSVNPPSH
jgi:hypothetical protein